MVRRAIGLLPIDNCKNVVKKCISPINHIIIMGSCCAQPRIQCYKCKRYYKPYQTFKYEHKVYCDGCVPPAYFQKDTRTDTVPLMEENKCSGRYHYWVIFGTFFFGMDPQISWTQKPSFWQKNLFNNLRWDNILVSFLKVSFFHSTDLRIHTKKINVFTIPTCILSRS